MQKQEMMLASILLRGTDLEMWNLAQQIQEDVGMRWNSFKGAIVEYFAPFNRAQVARDKLYKLKRTSSSLRDHLAAFQIGIAHSYNECGW